MNMYHNNDLIVARYFYNVYLCINKKGQYIVKVLGGNDIVLAVYMHDTKTQAVKNFLIEVVNCSNLTYEEVKKEYGRLIK